MKWEPFQEKHIMSELAAKMSWRRLEKAKKVITSLENLAFSYWFWWLLGFWLCLID